MKTYTDMFAKYILSCAEEWKLLAEQIDAGNIPGGHGVKMTIDIPADDIDRIRFERIAATAE